MSFPIPSNGIPSLLPLNSTEGSSFPFNYITEVQRLVSEIMSKLGRISENDHQAIEKIKHRFLDASFKSARLQTEFGQVNKNIGLASFGVMCVRLFTANNDDKEILNILSNQASNLGGMATSNLQSQMAESNAQSQLELERFRTKTSDKQAGNSAKQDCQGLLQAVAENQRSASRAMG